MILAAVLGQVPGELLGEDFRLEPSLNHRLASRFGVGGQEELARVGDDARFGELPPPAKAVPRSGYGGPLLGSVDPPLESIHPQLEEYRSPGRRQ